METLNGAYKDSLTNMSEKERTDNQLRNLEDQVAILKEAVQRIYQDGWNDAMDKAAFHMETQFESAFGKDTLSSVAIYIKGLKK